MQIFVNRSDSWMIEQPKPRKVALGGGESAVAQTANYNDKHG
jgi:hypothetical protein